MSTPSFDASSKAPALGSPPALTPVAILLTGSGFAALVYEVVWTRQLTYLFGATLYAVVTVLAAFMAGLALGAWWWGRRADEMRRPVMVYGFLELGVGLSALAFPWALRAVEPLWRWGYVALADHWTLFLTMRFAVIGALLLIPTFLMGGTLPVLLRSVAGRWGSVGGHVGWLYAANTLGAVAGAYASGFILLAQFGLRSTTWVAVFVNLTVCALALLLDAVRSPQVPGEVGPPDPRESAHPARLALSPAVARTVLGIYGVSGALALAYQVLWNRGLIFCFELMKNTTYVFSAILTVFLVGLALGSALMSPVARRTRDPLSLFAALEILLGVAVMISVGILRIESRLINEQRLLNASDQILWVPAVLSVFIRTAAVIGVPTLIMGMLYPLANAAYISGWQGAARRAGRLYAFNTTGAIAGSLAAGFLLLPLFGITGSLKLLAAVNVLLGLALVPLLPEATWRRRAGFAVLGVLALALGWRAVRTANLQPLNPEDTLIWYHEGRLATVSVVQTPDGYRDLYVDNNGVAGTAPYILTDQKSLAHFPALLLREPRSALTVGFGSGGASYSYSLYHEFERIDCVEITDDVLTADEYLTESNHGYTEGLVREAPNRWVNPADPRYRLIIDDARSYIQHSGRLYDVIATDCTDLRYKTNANLYDLEYFQACRGHITDDGMVVVWMPLGGLSDDLFRCALRTFVAVFPHTSVWFMNNAPTHYVLFIGTKSPQRYDFATITQRLADPRVRADLDEISLGDPMKILSCFVTDERRLSHWLGDGPLNTEDDPVIEFEAPKEGYGERPLIENTERLLSLHESVIPLVTHLSASEETRLARYEAAVPAIVEGLNLYRTGREFAAAAEKWREALRINPDDAAVQRLLRFEQLRRIAGADPATFRAFAQWQTWFSAHEYLVTIEQTLGHTEGAIDAAAAPLNALAVAMAHSDDAEESLAFANWRRTALLRLAELLRAHGDTEGARHREAEALEVQRWLQEHGVPATR
jgi:spermidine synthase